jgi:hypothetical protein
MSCGVTVFIQQIQNMFHYFKAFVAKIHSCNFQTMNDTNLLIKHNTVITKLVIMIGFQKTVTPSPVFKGNPPYIPQNLPKKTQNAVISFLQNKQYSTKSLGGRGGE